MKFSLSSNLLKKCTVAFAILVGTCLMIVYQYFNQSSLLDFIRKLGFTVLGSAFIGYFFGTFLTWLCKRELKRLKFLAKIKSNEYDFGKKNPKG